MELWRSKESRGRDIPGNGNNAELMGGNQLDTDGCRKPPSTGEVGTRPSGFEPNYQRRPDLDTMWLIIFTVGRLHKP